jgi:hypothetical protein
MRNALFFTRVSTGILAALFQGAFIWHFRDLRESGLLLKLQLATSPENFQRTLGYLDPQELRLVQTHYFLDVFYPIAYAGFLSSLLFSPRSRAFLIPWAAAFFDQMENWIQYSILTDRLPLSSPLFYLGSASAWIKWALIIVTIVLIAQKGRKRAA